MVVSPAPIHTSLHAILASGRYLKIMANSPEMMIRLSRRLTITEIDAPPGSSVSSLWLNPLMSEETDSETSSMKHTPPTMAKETKRDFT